MNANGTRPPAQRSVRVTACFDLPLREDDTDEALRSDVADTLRDEYDDAAHVSVSTAPLEERP